MAICKMLRLTLIGVNSEEDVILDTLAKTEAVHIYKTENAYDGFECEDKNADEVKNNYDRLISATEFLTKKLTDYGKSHQNTEIDLYKDVKVSYSEFINSNEREKSVIPVVGRLEKLENNLFDNKTTRAKINAEKQIYKPYLAMQNKFSDFCDTEKTTVILGLVPTSKVNDLQKAVDDIGFTALTELGSGELGTIVSVICLKELYSRVLSALYLFGFINCGMRYDYTAKQKLEDLDKQLTLLDELDNQTEEEIYSLKTYLRDFKILADYYLYTLEKLRGGDGFLRTKHSFILTAYCPEDKHEEIDKALMPIGGIYTEYEEVKDDEFAPTLCKNNKIVTQFESITDSFSTPKYGAIDPSPMLTVFFAIFMGFITADLGYGILMLVGGFLFAKGKKETLGVTKLAKVIAWSGIPTIIFGILFDSFFGFALMQKIGLISKPFMPDAVNDKITIAGITLPSMILISLGMGVVQIMASLMLKGSLEKRRGNIIDGFAEGYLWVIFLGGLLVLAFGLLQNPDTGKNILPYSDIIVKISLIVTLVALLLAVILAGRHEKALGKFTKGFGAIYGLINYMSDILSYVRLYGLMLSGAQIASIFTNTLAVEMLFPQGIGGVIIGIVVMFAGHAFNIAMGLLGAYIHDSRLQYIEFFGRFFEGEGERFTPLGSKLDFITVEKN